MLPVINAKIHALRNDLQVILSALELQPLAIAIVAVKQAAQDLQALSDTLPRPE